MTKKELNQLFYINRQLDRDKKRLAELEDAASTPQSPSLSGMPRSGAINKSVEKYAAEIADMKALIAARQIEALHEQARLMRYIDAIDDILTRTIFELRFVDGRSWVQVADALGGKNQPESVRRRVSRYIKSHMD